MEDAEDNIFTAGKLDLKLDGEDGITAKWTASAMAPGDTVDGTIQVSNAGNLDGTVQLDITATLTENGTPEGVTPEGSDAIGDQLIATSVTWDGVAVASMEGQTINDLVALPTETLGDIDASEEIPLYVEWTLHEDADSGVMDDEADITFTFTLTQRE